MSFAARFKSNGQKKTLEVKKETVSVRAVPPPVQYFQPKSVSIAKPKAVRQVINDTPRRSVTPTKRLASRSTTTSTPERVDFGRDDSATSSSDDEASHKRRKVEIDGQLDPDRVIHTDRYFSNAESKPLKMIHAVDMPRIDASTAYKSLFDETPEDDVLEFAYPSSFPPEKIRIIKAAHDVEGYNALNDIMESVSTVTTHYVPDDIRRRLRDDSTGIAKRLLRAFQRASFTDFSALVKEWNQEMHDLRGSGVFTTQLATMHEIKLSHFERIFNQAYFRTVSPKIKDLAKYEIGTDNVYGELLPRFVSKILKQDVKMTSSQVFVDLGSGVGNVVLQAALEIGCESWGCEMMTKYCDVADLQLSEFLARAKLWGLSCGKIHLERGDFLLNLAIARVLQRADVILVNNQVFTPTLNDSLTRLFLDLKEGTKIVSLKSFVPKGHKITERNQDSPYNILRVEEKEYFSGSVSWTGQGGKYFVSTKDSSALRRFAARSGR